MLVGGEEGDEVVVGSTGRSYVRSKIPDLDKDVRELEQKHGYIRPATLTRASIDFIESDYRDYLHFKEELFRDILRINTYVYLSATKALREGGLGTLIYIHMFQITSPKIQL
jgi:hypothetical protein